MKENVFIFVVLPGLCFLSACFSRTYIPVEKAMTWAEAQSYCRREYADLATVSNEEEFNALVTAAQKYSNDNVWIGLYDDINSWSWSLQNESLYSKGKTVFQMWNGGEPNNYWGLEDCVEMDQGWNDCYCQLLYQFVCYDGNGKKVNSSSYILMTEAKNWSDAQSYCRQFYTDLASVRSQTEYDEIHNLTQGQSKVWIGLHRDSWKWSDGSPVSFKQWIPPYSSQLSYINTPCVVLNKGQWEASTCDNNLFFVCYSGPVTQLIVRVKVAKSTSSVNLENATEAILEQFGQMLKGIGLSEDMKLTWRKQLNGKIFYLDKKVKKEQPQETICRYTKI